MIHYKTLVEIELMREAALIVSKTLAEMAKIIRPGITTLELDRVAETFIRDHHAIPGFKDYNGYPSTLCTSVNEMVVHGIPGKKLLKEGDIVSIDCGVIKDGFYGDHAYTFAIGEVKPEVLRLMKITRECLYLSIEKAVKGNRIGDISYTVQNHAEKNGYSVVRELTGHGLGKNLHEAPRVPNYGKRGRGPKIKNGLVIAIEPMINMGRKEVMQLNDGWTIITADRKPSAHFEHDVAIVEGKPVILSDFTIIDEVLKK